MDLEPVFKTSSLYRLGVFVQVVGRWSRGLPYVDLGPFVHVRIPILVMSGTVKWSVRAVAVGILLASWVFCHGDYWPNYWALWVSVPVAIVLFESSSRRKNST